MNFFIFLCTGLSRWRCTIRYSKRVTSIIRYIYGNYLLGTLGKCSINVVSVALGSGIESFIDKNEELSIFAIITSQDIYLPILAFLIVIILAFIFRKFIFKKP